MSEPTGPPSRQSEPRTQFGCDRCGELKSVHEGEGLICPGQRYSASKWSDSPRWIDDGHKFTAVFHYDSFRLKLICPDEGCTPVWCSCRGGDAKPDCPRCGGTGDDPDQPCWLQHIINEDVAWFQEASRWIREVDLTNGPVQILWINNYEELEWRPKT